MSLGVGLDPSRPLVRYMGNKSGVAGAIAAVLTGLPVEGPRLDLFCGMCSIGSALARVPNPGPVWGNDVHRYASLIAAAALTSRARPSSDIAERAAPSYSANRRLLGERFVTQLAHEAKLLASRDYAELASTQREWRHAANDDEIASEIKQLAVLPGTFPYRLCTLSFAYGYFGLQQAIDLDSVRFAIDVALEGESKRWAMVALLETASRVAAAPGHFAQFFNPAEPRIAGRIATQRRREIWPIFAEALTRLEPIGEPEWRKGNRVFRSDARNAWDLIDLESADVGVVYADPPYSRDQYSRFYHVLETLTAYDYPDAVGHGRYRADRDQTPFSMKSGVAEAFRQLCAPIGERGATLVLSYPERGLLHTSGQDLGSLLREFFGSVSLARRFDTQQSSMGARHVPSRQMAREELWIAS